jgi:diaminopimelate decarboxylase
VQASRWIDLVGVHSHIGSNIFLLSGYEKAVERLAPFVVPLGLPELCLGGGLGVAYVEGEETPSIAEWDGLLRRACAAAGITSTLVVEPGRAIVAAAAITLYRVGTIKELPDIRTYVAVDGGMSDNPRPVLYGSGYETFLPRATDADRPLVANVVGKHCESGDLIVRDACLPADLAVGDILATPVTGAYGHSMASNYNKVPRPPVVFVKDGKWRTVVRRETFDDLTRLDI